MVGGISGVHFVGFIIKPNREPKKLVFGVKVTVCNELLTSGPGIETKSGHLLVSVILAFICQYWSILKSKLEKIMKILKIFQQ